ncbi:MAG: GGDEF domain-containing protein [Geodermatophilaceae bacterium]|nr:GGDEF domain-containing protein [Geodermatophilaceae bacterium]
MTDSKAGVIRLLRLAQAGQPEQALVRADELLRAGQSLGVLYARAVALRCLGDHQGAVQGAEKMLAITGGRGITSSAGTMTGGTVTAGSITAGTSAEADLAGWHSIALAFRACQQMLISEISPQVFDLESTLHDLAQAEAALTNDVNDGFVLATAHTGLGHGYHDLRLYELALPHYEAALRAALTQSAEIAVTSQLNLAELHLNWSVELFRIRETARARDKSATAARHAVLAQEYASIDETVSYAAIADLLAACADSSGEAADAVVVRIRDGLQAVEHHGLRESRAFALPFLAWALERAGRLPEALEVAAQACDALPADATWMLTSAAYHTRAALLARSGSDAARAALAYGDQLAKTMWRQRLRTLHNARSVQILQRVTLERDRVQVLAHTDALTGIGNRRAFDVRVAELDRSADTTEVAMIVVDVDRLKAVNDAGGHEAGDLTLQAVAGALTGQVRAGDLVARLGGDEFVAVVEGTDHAQATALAGRMAEAVSLALGSAVTVSVGVATGPACEAGAGLLHAADRAMYAAKRASRVRPRAIEALPTDQSRTG